jgi:hypothetical protein
MQFLPMFRRIDPSRIAFHALARYLPLALAYLVIVRRISVPWRRVPLALMHSVFGRRRFRS